MKKTNKRKLLLLLLDTTSAADHSLLLPQLLPPQLLLPGTNFAFCWCHNFCILLQPAQDCYQHQHQDQGPGPTQSIKSPSDCFWALLPALIPNPIVIVPPLVRCDPKAQVLPTDPLLVAQGPLGDQQQVLVPNPLVGH